MVFDLVLPLSLEIGLDPVAALGLTKCGQAGWRAMKKTEGSPMLPGWKQLAAYLLQRALLCHRLSCVTPTAWREWIGKVKSFQGSEGVSSLPYSPGLVWTGAREKGWCDAGLEKAIWKLGSVDRTLLTTSWLPWTLTEGDRGASNSETTTEATRASLLFVGTEPWVTSRIQAEWSLTTWRLPGTLGNSTCNSQVGSPTQAFMKVGKGCVENS